MMYLLFFTLGAIFGSFFLVIGTRLPINEDIIYTRSRCDNCKHTLSWYELIPIFSFIFQKGKCNYCHKKIDSTHFFIEIICGILFLFGYLYFNISFKLFIYLIIVSVTLIIFISDFKYMIILDSPLIIGSVLILIVRYFEIGINGVLYSFITGIVMFLLMFLVKKLGNKLFKRESLGDGDIKLSFLIGISLGYPEFGIRMSLIALIFSAFLALPYAYANIYLNKKNELPYGPFLAASMVIVFIFYEKFTRLLIFFLL